MTEETTEVRLYVYDLTRGMARALSPIFLGECFLQKGLLLRQILDWVKYYRYINRI